MRSLHYTHNLPAIADKNSTHRVLPFTSIHNSSVLFFCAVQELILNTESIPLSLSLDSNDFKGLEIAVTPTSLTLKYQLQNLSLPLNVAKQKWLRLSFGQEMAKVEVRPQQNENKLDRTHFYSKFQLWKKEERKETAALHTLSLETYIAVLRNKTKLKEKDDGIDNGSRKDISRYLKMKLIERTSTTNNKPKLQPLTAKQSTLYANGHAEEQKSKNKPIIYQKYESATLDFNAQITAKDSSAKRDVNTSNSVRSEPTGIRFARHLHRLRDPKSRLSKNKDSQSSTEISEFVPVSNHHPKFYEQISLSHEQIELKRRKFDSQFIHKQKADLADKSTVAEKENNESQVKQQIHKMENSKVGSRMEDTLERGMFDKSRGNHAQDNEQSGTLCESVFE